MDFGQMIVDHAAPVLQRAGYHYDGPLVAERWNRTPDGNWIALLKLGHATPEFGDRYLHLRGPTLYHLQLGEYFHSRETAEREYARALVHSLPSGTGERRP